MNFIRYIFFLFFLTAYALFPTTNWVTYSTLEGGNVESIYRTHSGELFVNAGGAVFKSLNNADSWIQSTQFGIGMNNYVISSSLDSSGNEAIFAVDPRNDVIWSVDTGRTWQAYSLPEKYKNSKVYSIFGSAAGVLYLYVYSESEDLYRIISSRNNGIDFSEELTGYFEGITETSGGDLIAFGASGLYIKKSGSVQWVLINGLPSSGLFNLKTAGNNILIMRDSLFISRDLGATWTKATDSLGFSSGSIRFFGLSSGAFFAYIEDQDGSRRLMKLDDGASLWTKIDAEIPPDGFIEIIEGEGNRLFAANYRGVSVSADGAKTWTLKVKGMESYPLEVAQITDSGIIAGSFNGYLFKSGTTPAGWAMLNSFNRLKGDMPFRDILYLTNSRILISTRDGAYYSTDQGATWIRSAFPDSLKRGFMYLTETKDGKIFTANYNYILYSSDGGASWVKAGDYQNYNGMIAQTVDGKLIVGTNDGIRLLNENFEALAFALDGLQVPLVFAKGDSTIVALEAQPENKYVIWITHNNGGNWSSYPFEIFPGFEADASFLDMIVTGSGDYDGDIYFASIDGLMRMPVAKPGEWVKDELTDDIVTFLNFPVPGNTNQIIAAGARGRIYVGLINGTSVGENTDKAAASYIAPMPVNNTARIVFSSESAGDYKVVLQDLAGRSVMSFDRQCNPGMNTLELNLSDLPPGIYNFSVYSPIQAFSRGIFIKQ